MTVRIRVSKIGLAVLGLAIGYLAPCAAVNAQQLADGFLSANCPPEARQMPRSCSQVARIAYALATQKRGYQDFGGNGIPDVMERPYVIHRNDCSTGNAHAACMFNDPCTAPFGKLMGLRSNSAFHATVMFVGNDNTRFECDFTPKKSGQAPDGSTGIPIAHRADTRIGPAFPDPGESMDSAYNCTMNGANTNPLNPFGGSGGGFQSSLATLLMMLLQQQQLAQRTPAPSDLTVPTPIPTPTPQATPMRAEQGLGSSREKQSKPALDAMEMPEDDKLLGDAAASDEVDSLLDEDDRESQNSAIEPEKKKARSVWDRDSGDVFNSGNT